MTTTSHKTIKLATLAILAIFQAAFPSPVRAEEESVCTFMLVQLLIGAWQLVRSGMQCRVHLRRQPPMWGVRACWSILLERRVVFCIGACA